MWQTIIKLILAVLVRLLETKDAGKGETVTVSRAGSVRKRLEQRLRKHLHTNDTGNTGARR